LLADLGESGEDLRARYFAGQGIRNGRPLG
jgi:hypothetical protein